MINETEEPGQLAGFPANEGRGHRGPPVRELTPSSPH